MHRRLILDISNQRNRETASSIAKVVTTIGEMPSESVGIVQSAVVPKRQVVKKIEFRRYFDEHRQCSKSDGLSGQNSDIFGIY